jgi:hypothetical protein
MAIKKFIVIVLVLLTISFLQGCALIGAGISGAAAYGISQLFD